MPEQPPKTPQPESPPAGSTTAESEDKTLVVRVEAPRARGGWWARVLGVLLLASILANVSMYAAYKDYFASADPPLERYRSGSRTATERIAVVEISGTIMPPYTTRYIDMIERAADDENVLGLLLVVDSPGGLVADSHEIYHALEKFRSRTEKPIVVSMKRIAASGGLYVAMGAGPGAPIFAEPTTWTGSIGVIVPHYDLTEFGKKVGIAGTNPALKTGELKDSLSPLRPLSEKDVEVWTAILDDSFQRFLRVIVENRDAIDMDKARELATGQIYTADQAVEGGLVDEIGFEEDALAELRKRVGVEDVRVVTYYYKASIYDALVGSVEAADPRTSLRSALESTVPSAMYLCSWAPFHVSR